MRINKLNFPIESTSTVGLEAIHVERLGEVVVLIGKNGSGKTRLLDFIEDYFCNHCKVQDIKDGTITGDTKSIMEIEEKLSSYQTLLAEKRKLKEVQMQRTNHPTDRAYHEKYNETRRVVKQLEQQLKLNTATEQRLQLEIDGHLSILKDYMSRFGREYVKRIHHQDIQKLQGAMPDSDKEFVSFESLLETVSLPPSYNELNSLYNTSLSYLKKLPHLLALDWNECLGDLAKFQKSKSYKKYFSLKETFETFFEKKLEWKVQNVVSKITDEGLQTTQQAKWTVNGREFNYAEFSSGEKTLFAYVLLFFLLSQNEQIRLKESIIMIDEPELHLHADAEIDLIGKIRGVIRENGQLWIATHSINVLSQVGYDEIFVVKDGRIAHPSRTIQREALRELLKIEDRILKLSEFLTSMTDWAFVQFAIECFSNPQAIEVAQSNDPQIKTLKDIITDTNEGERSLLLDYGAGKGRIFDQLDEDSFVTAGIEYSALEPNQVFQEVLRKKGVKNVYSSYEELDEARFDYVVLCNVLHEIEIEKWVDTLNRIAACLKEGGFLIIMEAKMLAKGEHIGSAGYLVLGEEELEMLFNIKESSIGLEHKAYKATISCSLFKKSNISLVTNEKLIEVLSHLETRTIRKIEELRKVPIEDRMNNKKGRELAFLAILHINSRIAKERLSSLH